MRSVLIGVVISCVTAAATAETPVVNFAGPGAELRSPNDALRAYSADIPGKRDELPWHSVRIAYPDRHSERLHAYLRNANISWAPTSDALYISDIQGSNVADCFVVTPSPHRNRKVSLTDVISHGRFPGPNHFLKFADHGYVVCDRWEDSNRIHVTVYGDIFPYEYTYTFIYDRKRGIARQLSAKKVKRTD